MVDPGSRSTRRPCSNRSKLDAAGRGPKWTAVRSRGYEASCGCRASASGAT